MVQQPPVGQSLLILEASRSRSDTPHSVRLLWVSDQPDAEDLYLTTHNTHKRQIPCPRRDWKSQTQQASECRPKP